MVILCPVGYLLSLFKGFPASWHSYLEHLAALRLADIQPPKAVITALSVFLQWCFWHYSTFTSAHDAQFCIAIIPARAFLLLE